MKAFFLPIFSLILYNYSFAQDSLYISKQDTVYVILPQTDVYTSTKFKGFRFVTSGNRETNEENFYIENNHPISIYTQKMGRDNKKVKRKDFLKKNKDRVIDLKFLETYSPKKIFVDMFRFKDVRTVVYIIDEKQLRKRKITLRKAYVYAELYMEM